MLLLLFSIFGLFIVPAINASRVVCYYSSWAIYRPGAGHYTVGDIDPTICTHVVYAFVSLSDTGNVEFLDPWNDIGDASHPGQLQQMLLLKKVNPDVKLMLAIGGYNHGPKNFQEVVRKPVKRAIFVQSAFDLLMEYSFDGLDIDWEYQDSIGGTEADRTGLSALLQEMRTKFDEASLLISIATQANFNLTRNCYELDKISESVDFINVMSYDLHGPWESFTGHVSPIYADPNGSPELSMEAVLKHYIERGAVPEKINFGLVTYGRSYTLADTSKHGLGAPALGPGQHGDVYPDDGYLAYADICQNKWTEEVDEVQGIPYAYKGDQWVGYDNPESIKRKIEFVKTLGITSAMVWSLETDDKDGICTGETYPYIRAVFNGVQ